MKNNNRTIRKEKQTNKQKSRQKKTCSKLGVRQYA